MLELREDSWLGERFGHPVFSAALGPEPSEGEAADELAGELESRGLERASFQAKGKIGDVAELRRWESSGFGVVCVAINLSRTLRLHGGTVNRTPAVAVDFADSGRDRGIVEIAGRSLDRTRFHLDPKVDPAVARKIKEDWAANCLAGNRGEFTLVSRKDGQPTGFLAAVEGSDEGERALVIDLIAIDPSYRRAGSGRALVERFFAEALERGYSRVAVGTQLANERSLSFYASSRFVFAGSTFDLHAHSGLGEQLATEVTE